MKDGPTTEKGDRDMSRIYYGRWNHCLIKGDYFYASCYVPSILIKQFVMEHEMGRTKLGTGANLLENLKNLIFLGFEGLNSSNRFH